MKKFLLAIFFLIVVAAAALAILIYSIDWNEHKAKIAGQFSAATGKKVVFAGPIELKFLPSPYLTASDIKIYSEKADNPQPLAEVERLVARLDLVPLLKGEFNVEQMTLQHPTVRMKIMDDGSLNWAGELTAQQKQKMEEIQVKLMSLSIEKATLTFYDAKRGIDWKFDNLSAEIMADSLFGPFHIEGSYIKDNNPAGFALSIGRITENMNTSINVGITNPSTQTMLRFDGSVMPKNDVVTGNIVFESKRLMNFVTENFKNVQFEKQYDMPLAVSTQINTNKQKVELSNLIVKYGTTAAAGNVIIPRLEEVTDWSQKDEAAPRQKIELAFNFTDFDLAPVVAYLQKLLKTYDQGKTLEIKPKADIMADLRAVKAQYGKQEIKNLELSVDVLPGKLKVNKLLAQLPGNTNLNIKGEIFPDDEGIFQYKTNVSFRADELVELLRSMEVNPPLPVPSIYRKLTGTAAIEGSLSEIKITPLDFTLDKTKVAGDIAVMRKDGKLKLLVIGDIDSINFDNYVPMLPEDVAGKSLQDRLGYRFKQLSFLKDADVQFLFKLGLGIYDNLPFEKLVAEGTLQNGIMDFKRLNVPSLSGGSLEVSGKLKGFGQDFEFENLKYKFQNPDIFSLLSKFAVELPDWNLNELKNFTAEGIATGTLRRFALKNVSQLANMEMSFGGEINETEAGRVYEGNVYLKAPDFINMLRNFKVNYAPNVYSLGVFTLNANLVGKSNDFVANALEVSIGQNRFQGDLKYSEDKNIQKISGQLKINQFELERFMYNGEVSRVNSEVVSFKKADNEKVDFLVKPLFSTTKINYDFYKNLDVNLNLTMDKLAYENFRMQNASTQLLLAGQVAKLKDFAADYNKGKIKANLELDFKTNPLLKGNILLNDVNLDDGFWSGTKYGINYGLMTSNTSFSTDASSVEDMIKNLDAASEFKIQEAEFKGWNLAAIKQDLKQRNNEEGLSKLVRDNLESGKTIFKSINGIWQVSKGNYTFTDLKFLVGDDENLRVKVSGSLPTWDVNAMFTLLFKSVNLPAINFGFKGALSAPQLDVNVQEIVNVYQRKHAEIAAQKQAKEQAYLKQLQKNMNEQMSVAKAMENRLNNELKQKFAVVNKQIKNPATMEKMQQLNEELDNISKGLAEVLTLGLSPKFENQQIDDAKRRNELLQKRIDRAEAELIKNNVDDIKYRTNLLYNQIAEIHTDAQRKLNLFKSQGNSLNRRLEAIKTDYTLNNDAKAAALKAVVESLFVELDDINTSLSQDYVQMQNTLDPVQLSKYEAKIAQSLQTAKDNQTKLESNIKEFSGYAEVKVAEAEKAYQDKLRQEEIERKLKENTGKISIVGAGKSVTVTRDIEDIEKSESLQEQQKIPVLDFSAGKTENVIIKQGAKPKPIKVENKDNLLTRTDGKISKASGVIVRK